MQQCCVATVNVQPSSGQLLHLPATLWVFSPKTDQMFAIVGENAAKREEEETPVGIKSSDM